MTIDRPGSWDSQYAGKVVEAVEEPFMITLRVTFQVQGLESFHIECFSFLPLFVTFPRETSIAKEY